MSVGPERGLACSTGLATETTLAGYHLLPAARADMLRRLGRPGRGAGRVPARARARAGGGRPGVPCPTLRRVASPLQLLAMARKIPSLGHFLGVRALYAMAYGEISSSLYYALGITAVYALADAGRLPAAGFLFALAAAAYAEGGATIPEPGGASGLRPAGVQRPRGFHRRLGDRARLRARDLALGPLPAVLLRRRARAVRLVPRGQPGRATVAAVAIVLVVTVIRMLRRTDAYTIGVAVAALDLVLCAVGIAIFGLMLLLSVDALKNSIDLGTVPTWNSLAFALPIAMIGYTGLEKVGSLAGVAKNPEKSLPDAVRTSVFTVVIVYSAVATAAVLAFPAHPDNSKPGGTTLLGTQWVDTPMLGLAHAISEKGPSSGLDRASMRIRFTACTILLMAIATSFSGCARLAEAMGRHTQLPAGLQPREPGGAGPAGGDHPLEFSVLAVGFLVVGSFFSGEETVTLASLYSFGILIAFMLTQAAIIWLRISEPDLPRPFMMKGNVWIRQRLIPVTSVVGVILRSGRGWSRSARTPARASSGPSG